MASTRSDSNLSSVFT